MNLQGKVAIVTGGAVGIGRAISVKLASLGATIIVNYNSSTNAAESLVEELTGKGFKAVGIKADVSDFAASQKLIENAVEKYQRVDILVNNAGINIDTLILRMTEDDFDRVLKVNLKGAWNCSKHVARIMSKNRYGKIINISSVVGIVGNIGQTNYCAAKAGLIGLTKALARELAKRNVCVNAVAPGFIDTKMTQQLDSRFIEQIINSIPLGKQGLPADVANLVAFLASDLSDYITGQVINVDGGMVMY
ncbi:MAG: 3-oxoacyl-[acyl-carrier-protein] reductase [Bacilli bacterium]|nr:3-oxoacyl-[acyl-carrier-protein] reductase [Bacilli bacterium]MDD4077809.1 3-oxoacyl-[acyl-carrier-protein] reductase [Bacilli bacterium]